MTASEPPLYLGLDLSTQQLKVVCIDDSLSVTHKFSVPFDSDLPEFGTSGGVIKHNDGLTVTAPTIMWVKALDLVLSRMHSSGFPFSRVVAISGSGQQHGSVFWRHGAGQILASLHPSLTLAEQLEGCFSLPSSPVWMDSSTSAQCRQLEEACGGPQQLASRTGSRAYERFTGNQIAKVFQLSRQDPAYHDYRETERISLVSSFSASLLLGCYANIDYSDGSGMNIMDIAAKTWWKLAMDACAPDLGDKLGKPMPSSSVLGCVSNYLVQRFGFSADCKVVAFTGDNPASLAGMRLERGDVVVSLGTSDTLFVWINEAQPQLTGHVFVNPVEEEAYMALLCYKNGSRSREAVRDDCAEEDLEWKEFGRLLDSTDPGNSGHIGIYFHDEEITPTGQGIFRFDAQDQLMRGFPPAVEARAVIEGQFMAKFVHARNLGYKITAASRVLATGGASSNSRILQIIADIFNTSVFILKETANSASLGSAYRAKHAVMSAGTSFGDAVCGAPPYKLAVSPRQHIHEQVYLPLMERYATLESLDFKAAECEGTGRVSRP